MMDDENGLRNRQREYERPYPRPYTRETMRGKGNNRNRSHATQPKGTQPHVLGVQIVICVLSLLAVLALHIAKSPVDQTMRQALNKALTSQLNQKELAGQISQVMKRLQIGLPDVKSVFNTSSRTVSAGSSKPVSSSSALSSLASSVSSSAVASQNTSSSGASQPAENPTSSSVSASLSGEGGADLTVQPTGSVLVPPASVSLGPYLLSAQPVWPVQGRITSPFGFRINPVTHKHSFHTGLDIAAPKDTPISAALPGVVKQAGQSADYGNFLLIDHGGGVETFYGHCDQLLVGQGTPVKIGDTIAKVGSTGLSTGYHLHFEIHIDGVCVDPARALGAQV